MNLNALFHPVMKAVSADAVQEHIEEIWQNNRTSCFRQYEDTAEYVRAEFEKAGLETEFIRMTADGCTRIGDAVMPLAWNCESAIIELTAPTRRTLAVWDDNPNCTAMWSPSTPGEGLEADVVFLKKGEAGELESLDVKGKFVYTPGRLDDIRHAASRAEIYGVISSWLPNPKASSDVQWIGRNADNPGGWGTLRNEAPLLALAVPPETGEELLRASENETVTIRVRAKTTLTEGLFPAVTALIPGDPGPGEVLLYAPLYGQGAHFNASNAAALLEGARVLQSLINDGVLPRPQRGIRFLLGPKIYGSLAFAKMKKDILSRTHFALHVESGAGNPDVSWCRWSYRVSPVCHSHFSDGLAWHVIQEYLRNYRPQRFLERRPFSLAADVCFNDPKIGVPTHWLYGGTDEECRNTSADTPDGIDPRSCVDLTAASASLLYTLSAVGVADVPYMAFWNYTLSQERLRGDIQMFLDRINETRSLTDLNDLLGEASRHFPLRVEREKAALQSLETVDEDVTGEMEWAHVVELQMVLDDLGKSAVTLIRNTLETRAVLLGLEVTDLEIAPNVIEDERVPRRIGKTLGTITLDALPYDRWTTPVKKSPRSNVPFILSWWLADGKRTIGQIQRLLHLEITRYRECIPAWFNFLEKHGYVSFTPATPEEEAAEQEEASIFESWKESSTAPVIGFYRNPFKKIRGKHEKQALKMQLKKTNLKQVSRILKNSYL